MAGADQVDWFSVFDTLCMRLKVRSCRRVRSFARVNVFVLQERLNKKDQKISENFYVRGDGTVGYLLL